MKKLLKRKLRDIKIINKYYPDCAECNMPDTCNLGCNINVKGQRETLYSSLTDAQQQKSYRRS